MAGRRKRPWRSNTPTHAGNTRASASQAPRERHSNNPAPNSAAAAVLKTTAAGRCGAGSLPTTAGTSRNRPSNAVAAYRPKAIIGKPKPSRVTPSARACRSSAPSTCSAMHSTRLTPASNSAQRAWPGSPATASPTGSNRASLASSFKGSTSVHARPPASANPALCRARYATSANSGRHAGCRRNVASVARGRPSAASAVSARPTLAAAGAANTPSANR